MKSFEPIVWPAGAAALLLATAGASAQPPAAAEESEGAPRSGRAASVSQVEPALGFELTGASGEPVGWRLDGAVAVDENIAFGGARSLRLTGDASRAARATLRLTDLPSGGNRIRVGMQVRADGDADAVDLLLRIDGPDGLIYIDRSRHAIAAAASQGWERVEVEAPVFESASSLDAAVVVDRGTVWLDALSVEAASTEALPPPSAAATRYVDYALGLIDAHSIYRAGLDWPRFRADVLAQARGAETQADAHFAVRYAIGRLGDRHAYLRGPDRAEALGRAPVSNARTGRPPIAPESRILAGGIGYVAVPGFAGGTHMQQVEFAEALQDQVRSLDARGACGWIVDLRSNSGGNLWPMLLGLGPLIGDGDAVVATYPDGRRETVWYRDGATGLGEFARLRVRGEPHRVEAGARVGVLIGPRTASAGEVLAMAFRGVDGRLSFGTETGGVNTGTRTFVLLDGAELVLAVVTMSDRTGRAYRGPVRPDVQAAAVPRGIPLPEQPEVEAALDWLAEGC